MASYKMRLQQAQETISELLEQVDALKKRISLSHIHCDGCGFTWLDDGCNPIGCPYCKQQVAELALKEAQEQEPCAFWWIGPDGKDNGGPYRGKPSDFAIDKARNMGCEPVLLYASPVPAAPAVAVPANQLLLDILLKTRPLITCVSGNGKPKVQMQFSSLANAQDWYGSVINALLQSAPQPATTGETK